MKIRKIITLISFAVITLAVNVSAKEKVYSDENISLRYDALDETSQMYTNIYENVGGISDTAEPSDLSVNHDITSKEVEVYWSKFETPQKVTLYFMDGVMDIPYFELSDFADLKNDVYEKEEREASLTISKEGAVATLIRENGAKCVFDFKNTTIHFDNFNQFIQSGFTDSLVSVVWAHETFEDGEAKYFKQTAASNNRAGKPVTLNLSEYQIPMICQNGQYFVPVQTMSDFFMTEVTDFFTYNGKYLFITDVGTGNETYCDKNAEGTPGERSGELAEFAYNELTLALNFNYGQKEEQKIEDFREFFKETGLDTQLRSTDVGDSMEALFKLVRQYLGGQHNSIDDYTYLYGSERKMVDVDQYYEYSRDRYNWLLIELFRTREEFYYEGDPDVAGDLTVPGYEEVGDTAYIITDRFEPHKEDYYNTIVTKEDLARHDKTDIMGLIQYAHKQINRENSPIKNVVIDLSLNRGGDVDAGIYLLGWILGTAPVSVLDSATGAASTSYYRTDANYDGVYDEQDCLAACGKKVYCLVSGITFSCGNYVACVLKATHGATLIGQTTGGGVCSILPFSIADGTGLGISGRNQLCILRNGTYYNVEQGAQPDIALTDYINYYDHEKLTEIIDNLN